MKNFILTLSSNYENIVSIEKKEVELEIGRFVDAYYVTFENETSIKIYDKFGSIIGTGENKWFGLVSDFRGYNKNFYD